MYTKHTNYYKQKAFKVVIIKIYKINNIRLTLN